MELIGFHFEEILKRKECDAFLGNGGLGRLAACYHDLDSCPSQELPVWSYDLRYEYAILQQLISPEDDQLQVSPSYDYSSAFQRQF